MKGDFTRSTFRREKHYSGVRMQQGRVQLDADWNEQIDIQAYLDQVRAIDVIGACGVPKTGGGFQIAAKADGSDLTISAGRIYVDGLLGENEALVDFAQQPDLPGAQPLSASGTYLAYLDLWQQHVTALEDASIREVALGGPDTATRTRTVWQVNLLRLDNANAAITCKTLPDWKSQVAPAKGKLSAQTTPQTSSPNPCVIEPGAGYRRLENQLYRIEIHQGSASGQATFKFSRDNGSVVAAWISQSGDDLTVSSLGRDKVLSFAPGQWVELTDESRELLRQPGTLVRLLKAEGQVLTIDPATATGSTTLADFPRNPKIRRWDMAGTTGEINVTGGSWIAIEDGIEIQFDMSGVYLTGDYWLIPARTAIGDIEWPFTDPQAPHGVEHHICALAVINFTGTPIESNDIEDCRDPFPSLTTICAEDVCFDNSTCDLAGAETVQQALDQLCKERDLRFHNKHLHGWGIVCGLEVTCGPTDATGQRARVTIGDGYAIDCEGNDILLDQDETIDLMTRVRELDLLPPGTDGEVCLTLEGAGQYGFEKYDPAKDTLQALLSGTLLLDFYNDCIKNIQDFFEKEFTPPPEEKDLPAGPVTQRVAAFTNLMAQPINPQAGQHIFISPREDAILRKFYADLKAILQSETFCAMFENARPFPDYPFSALGMDTIFAKSRHVRLRLRPGGKEAYTVGPGINPLKPETMISRFDLEKRVLISQINPLTGAQGAGAKGDAGAGAVQDVAFSPDGGTIYAIIPTQNDENTFFRAGEITRDGIRWGALFTICGVKLVTVATTKADPNVVYATGLGQGLYRIDPANVDPNMTPLVAFNAVGHLKITADGRAFATVAMAGAQPTLYRLIVRMQVPGGTRGTDVDLGMTGNDDIAVFTFAEGAKRETIYSVAGPSAGSKFVLAHDMTSGAPIAQVPIENTTIRLEPYAPTDMLLLASEDGYYVRMIDMTTNQLVPNYRLPVQVGPIAIAADAPTQFGYVLNYVSTTLSVVPGKLFTPTFSFPFAALAAYRKGVLEAFADLLAGFLQYLKDCLCDHFLVKCPTCDTSDKIYLACVTIRNDQVYKVCNFSKRRYVKSFPTVGYWLSLVPILPLIDKLIEQFCCMILPDLFGRFTVPEYNEAQSKNPQARVKIGGAREGVSWMQTGNILTQMKTVFGKGQVAARVLSESISQPQAVKVSQAEVAKRSAAIVDQPVEHSETMLKAQGIEVERKPYDPASLSNLTTFFKAPTPGSKVTLYAQEGRVRYYTVEAAPSTIVQEKVTTLSQSVETSEAELKTLRSRLEAQEAQWIETRRLLEQKDDKIAALSNQVQSLEQKQASVETGLARSPMAEVTAKIAELERALLNLTPRETRHIEIGSHEWLVAGNVRDPNGRPMAGVIVRVFDRDRKYDDLLGEIRTDDRGDFTIIYHERDFAEVREKLPELYVMVQDASGQVLYSSRDSVRFNAGRSEYFAIKLGGEANEAAPSTGDKTNPM